MTVVADSKKRVTLRGVLPGDRFDVHVEGQGRYVLTKLEPVQRPQPNKVRFEKRGSYTVAVTERPINMDALRETLAEFP
jgi:hypothetical protein